MSSQYKTIQEQDEIDLFNFFFMIWREKWVVLGVTALVMLFGLIYILLCKPLYRAEVILNPPISLDLTPVNYKRITTSTLKPVTPNDAYITFKEVLYAKSTEQLFKSEQKKRDKQLNQGVLSAIRVQNAPLNRVAVIASATTPQAASDAVQQFILLVTKLAANELKIALNKELTFVRAQTKKEIDLLRISALRNRKYQLIRLKDALKIAQSINLENPDSSRNVGADIVNSAYLRGSNALSAEIASLKKQNSIYFSSLELAKLNDEYSELDYVKLPVDEIVLAKSSGSIVTSVNLKYKNATRIMIVSCLLGFIVSFFTLSAKYMTRLSPWMIKPVVMK